MTLKRPVSVKQAKRSPVAAARRDAFCARMGGMKTKLTSKAKAADPRSKVNKALAHWDCDIPTLLKSKHIAKGVRMNPVPASSRAGASRRVKDQIDQAADLYERFSGHDAWNWGKLASQICQMWPWLLAKSMESYTVPSEMGNSKNISTNFTKPTGRYLW
jgi:hypothetical protein